MKRLKKYLGHNPKSYIYLQNKSNMNKLFLFLLFLIANMSTKSQVYIDCGLGYSVNRALAAELNIRKTYLKDYFLQIGYFNHISNKIDNGVVLNISSGIEFKFKNNIKALPSVGWFYHLKSQDYTSLNTKGVIVSQKFTKRIDNSSTGFINLTFGEGIGIVTLGMSSKIGSQKNIQQKPNKLPLF